MTIDARSTNRNYPIPASGNTVAADFTRLIDALVAVDADVASLMTSVSARALLTHGHAIADVSGLASALEGKASASHVHALSDLTDVQAPTPTNGQFLRRVAGKWQPVTLAAVDVSGLGTMATETAANYVSKAQGAAVLPSWANDAARPASPVNGWIGYNSTRARVEGYVGGAWSGIGTSEVVRVDTAVTLTSVPQTLTITGGYDASTVKIFRNGILIDSGFTASNGTTITISTGTVGDVVRVLGWNGFSVANAVPLTGGSMSGDLAIVKTWPAVVLDKSSTATANQIIGKTNGVTRWVVRPGDDTVGDHFTIARYDDLGNFIDVPFLINRATGVAGFLSDINLATIAPGVLRYIRCFNNSTDSSTESRVEAATGTAYAQLYLLVRENGTSHADAAVVAGAGTIGMAFHCWNVAGNYVFSVNGTPVMRVDAAGVFTASRVQAPVWDVVVSDQKASGTAGGTPSSGAQTRTLNTVEKNTISASLASNVLTLPAGTYEIEFDAPCAAGGGHRVRLVNSGSSAVLGVGSNEYAPGTTQTRSFGRCEVTFASSTGVRIDHYIGDGYGANGLGVAVSSGEVEVYARMRVRKVA